MCVVKFYSAFRSKLTLCVALSVIFPSDETIRGRTGEMLAVPLQTEFTEANVLKMTLQRGSVVQFEQGILA